MAHHRGVQSDRYDVLDICTYSEMINNTMAEDWLKSHWWVFNLLSLSCSLDIIPEGEHNIKCECLYQLCDIVHSFWSSYHHQNCPSSKNHLHSKNSQADSIYSLNHPMCLSYWLFCHTHNHSFCTSTKTCPKPLQKLIDKYQHTTWAFWVIRG